MEDENNDFDLTGAVDSISSDLGLAGEAPAGDDSTDLGAPPPETSAPANVASTPAGPAPTPELPPAPRSWRKEAAETWAALPEQARNEVLKREEDILRGIEGYKATSAFGERMQAAIQPFQQYFQQVGVPPEQMFNSLMSAHMFLSNGAPEQKMAVFQKLAADYGIDLGQAQAAPAGAPDPQVQELRRAVQQLGGQLHGMTQAQHRAVFETNLKQVTEFSQHPDHPHFEEVADIIATMMEKGIAKNLQEAYDKAVWQHEGTRAKVIEKMMKDAETKRQQEAKDRTAAARRATSANIAARDRAGKPTAQLGTIDDTLAETLSDIKSRAA